MSDLRDTINREAADAYADARDEWVRAGCPDDDTIPDDIRAMGGGPFGSNDWLDEIPWVGPTPTPEQQAVITRVLSDRRAA